MSTFAILGATGQTGSEIVKLLLPTSAHLNIYARSASRLQTKHPTLSSASNVTTFIGDLSDTNLLAACLADVDVVFSTVAQNQNEPGCSVAQRTASAIIQALEARKGSGKCPTVVFLASFSVDPDREANRTTLGRFIHTMLYHVYTDLEKANELLRSEPWIPLVIAAPGALIHDQSRGVELTGDTGRASPLLSYPDLAKGMIKMGEDGDKWVGKYVGMVANEGKAIGGNPLALLRYLLPNLLAMACPPLWRLGRNWWPV